MKRDPSIHITKFRFEKLLSQLNVKDFPVETFFMLASNEAINTRIIQVTNNKVNKRITNLTLASRGEAALVADIIYATRIKLKHKGVRKIKESDTRNWAACKKIAEVCNIFCQDFGFETRPGFIKYIELGIQRLNGNYKNLVNRLPLMSENISAMYSAQGEWLNLTRTDREVCIEIQKHYVKRIADTTGIYETFEKDAEKMEHFLKLYRLCQEHNWPPKQFIDAQFESLAWCNGLPDIAQLYNDKAIERYNKYLFKINSKQKSQEPEEETFEGSIWDKINS